MVQNQTAHWDIQNKVIYITQAYVFFVLNVPVRSLRSSMADFIPCGR